MGGAVGAIGEYASQSQLGYEAELKGNHSAIIALIFGAIAILIIAWINYINLTVARSMAVSYTHLAKNEGGMCNDKCDPCSGHSDY